MVNFTAFRSSQLRISQAKLVLSIVLGIVGVIVAFIVMDKQIKIVVEQTRLSKQMFKISSIRYSIDKLSHQIRIAPSAVSSLKKELNKPYDIQTKQKIVAELGRTEDNITLLKEELTSQIKLYDVELNKIVL